MKKITIVYVLLLAVLLLLLLLFGCVPSQKEFVRTKEGAEQASAVPTTPTSTTSPPAAPPSAPAAAPTTTPAKLPSTSGECTVNADCASGTLCIDNACKTIASLYNTACAKKCTVETVDVTTSDGEKYTLARTQGSYTAAGALEWKVGSIPLYCPGQKATIPFHFIKKTTGKVLSEEVVTVEEGQTSPVITHPLISRVKFTVRVDKVKEVC